ncbi:DUF6545 domain-containing protein [Streptomyces sp. NPDC051704]|uniref:DUF6545 domain-containing protein n=1 Tax=Streptomyces sp. NPDC051704 TaxID=3365671 RepID=UPI00379D9361
MHASAVAFCVSAQIILPRRAPPSPDIVPEPPGAAPAPVSDLNHRLHRRVIEVRDGWRDLRPYIDRSAAGSGSRIRGRATRTGRRWPRRRRDQAGPTGEAQRDRPRSRQGRGRVRRPRPGRLPGGGDLTHPSRARLP